MASMEMDHDVDPKEKLLSELGDLSDIQLGNSKVLVGVYIRPQKTKSGLWLTDKAVDEDRWQGKVGLVVKHGPLAFDPENEWFEGTNFKLHDWVFFRPSDGWSITINGVLCRVLGDTQIVGSAGHSDRVW